MRHWRNENTIITTTTIATPSPRSIKCVGIVSNIVWDWLYHFRKQFSFIRRQHSFKLRSTFQELDREDDLVFTRRDLRRGEVSG